jgi:UTP:GlnB (protein PII) uridylyltransferase
MNEFLKTMPAAYARAFGVAEVTEHARIVNARGSQLVHAEICAGRTDSLVCVVADDRPGLLALVTDALLVHGLGVQGAQVYCRVRADGQAEAVDFFRLQPPASGEVDIGPAEVAAFLQTLSELVTEETLASSRSSAPPPPARSSTRVYFELEALRRGKHVLLVEAPDSQGLLNAVTNALHGQGARILASEIRTVNDTVYDRFEIESSDSQPLTDTRLCDIQLSVHAALPGLGASLARY